MMDKYDTWVMCCFIVCVTIVLVTILVQVL